MAQIKKSAGYVKGLKYLFMLFLSASILFSSTYASIQPDTARRDRPQAPPHPKPKSIKEIWTKINPFKKHKNDQEQEAVVDPKPLPPPPQPDPPQPITPKPTVKHKSTVKKKKTTTVKPAQPLI